MKSYIKRLIYRLNLHNLLQQFRNQQIINANLMKVTGQDVTFYPESHVENMTDDPSRIKIKNNTHIRGTLLVFKYGGTIEIGENCYIGDLTRIWSGNSIKIGNDVLISHNVNIIDTNSHELNAEQRATSFKALLSNGHPMINSSIHTAPIIIEDNVWINFNSIILKGVKIGKGAIVAAGSVVTKDVEAWTLVAGNPAKIVKNLSPL